MRLGFIHNTYKPWMVGGAEKSLQVRAEALAAAGNSVSVLTLAADGVDRTEDMNGVRVFYCGLPWSSASPHWKDRHIWKRLEWHFRPEFSRRLLEHRFLVEFLQGVDIVNTVNLPGIASHLLVRLRAENLPTVQTVADYFYSCARLTMYRTAECESQCSSCKWITRRRRRFANLLSGLVFVSDYLRRKFDGLSVFNPDIASTVIPNSYEFSECEPARPAVQSPIRFGYIGQIKNEKGVSSLLAAFANLRKSTDSSLRIAGAGDQAYLASLKQRFDCSDVIFTGWEEHTSFYSSIDVVVVPSLWGEPLSRIPFEANAHGVPVLVSTRGGIKELVTPHVNGLVYDPGITGELEKHLHLLANSPARVQEMANSSWAYAKERFSPSINASQYQHFFEQILRNKQTIVA